jgi:uncharacterized protein YqjF (DUF2071 family)
VPFELDTFKGDAYVSVVAFTQSRLRPVIGGRITAMMSAPLAEHEFLNLRAYVRVNGEPAIYFISEWIPNRLAALIGPRMYGLPYRLGAVRHEHAGNVKRGCVVAPGGRFEYRAAMETTASYTRATSSSRDHFLLERYLATTCGKNVARCFRVAHAPWPQCAAKAELFDTSLLRSVGRWTDDLELVGANYSPGAAGVEISPPARITFPARSRASAGVG